MPFGVELPDNIGQSAPDTGGGEGSPPGDTKPGSGTGGDGPIPVKEVSSKANQPETAKEILDLDKLERFRFAGREWKPKDLHNAYLRQEDYTRKTQEVAEARKYADNFHADLQKVIRDPALMKELRAVYPKAYAEAAEQILMLRQSQQQGDQSPQANTAGLPKEVVDKIASLEQKFGDLEKEKQDNEVKQLGHWLDNQCETLSNKYPSADTEVILARAEVLSKRGTEINEKLLDKLYAEHDKSVSERWDKRYKEKVDSQIKAGFKARDVGTGGGIPTGAPRSFKTIKEGTAAFLADIAAK